MGKNRQQGPPPAPSPRTIVYQNADFVSAMLQEMYPAGLLESSERDSKGHLASSTSTQRKAAAGAKAEGALPAIVKAAGQIDGERVRERAQVDERTSAERQKFVFSQAYYLDVVRSGLIERGQLSTAASTARVGDVVEFTAASMRPNEVNALLDIATPRLVGEITRFMVRQRGRAEIQAGVDQAGDAGVTIDVEKITAQRALHEAEATDKAEVAVAIAEAMHVDARRTATREYHAVVDGYNAVVMCDAAHFVTADPDRLLDGSFTILGKVIKPLTGATPILANNKLLRRIRPAAVETLLGMIGADENAAENFDLEFATEIPNAITVMPIAIYI